MGDAKYLPSHIGLRSLKVSNYLHRSFHACIQLFKYSILNTHILLPLGTLLLNTQYSVLITTSLFHFPYYSILDTHGSILSTTQYSKLSQYSRSTHLWSTTYKSDRCRMMAPARTRRPRDLRKVAYFQSMFFMEMSFHRPELATVEVYYRTCQYDYSRGLLELTFEDDSAKYKLGDVLSGFFYTMGQHIVISDPHVWRPFHTACAHAYQPSQLCIALYASASRAVGAPQFIIVRTV